MDDFLRRLNKSSTRNWHVLRKDGRTDEFFEIPRPLMDVVLTNGPDNVTVVITYGAKVDTVKVTH